LFSSKLELGLCMFMERNGSNDYADRDPEMFGDNSLPNSFGVLAHISSDPFLLDSLFLIHCWCSDHDCILL
jgi:hypothetical protein